MDVPGFKVLTAVDGIAPEYVEMTCYLEKSVTWCFWLPVEELVSMR